MSAEADRLVKYPMKSEAIENRRADVLADCLTLGPLAVIQCCQEYGLTRHQITEIITRQPAEK